MKILRIVLLLIIASTVPGIVSSTMLRAQTPIYRTSTMYDEPGSEGREHPLDFERLRLTIKFDANAGKVFGDVTEIFTPVRARVDSIVLDAINMTFSEVYLGGKQVRYSVTDSTITLYPAPALNYGVRDSLRFVYTCTPKKGLYFTGWQDATNRTRKQIWSQGEDSDNRYWIPMYDYPNDKMITETIITFDSKYKVLSNGNLLSSAKNTDGTTTWHYAMTKPHVTYLIMIAIGNYAIEERVTKRGIPVHLWYYPEYPERIAPTYQYSTEMIDFMEELLGVQYPWETYAQVPVQDFIFGAMENTTATIFGDFSLQDARGVLDRRYLNTNVHELTHQWFGDLITERNWKNIWLHESFATFYPKLFSRKFFGEDMYEWMRRGEQNQALAAGANDRLPIVHDASGTTRRYPKGSAVLDMLRYVIGDEDFDRTVAYYLKKHAYDIVHTDEFYLAFHDACGYTLDWFFREWLYHGGEPKYKVSYSDISDMKTSERSTVFTVEQTQYVDELTPLFTMPIVFEVYYKDGSKQSVRQTISKQTEIVRVPNPGKKEIAFTLFDPGSYILKALDFSKSTSELMEQAQKAEHMIDRYDAISRLRDDSTTSDDEIEKVMATVYAKEKFHAVKGKILERMAGRSSETALALMRKGMKDADVDVRKAAINALRRVPEALRRDVEELLRDSSYSVIESAFTKLCESFPDKSLSYCSEIEDVTGPAMRVSIAMLEHRISKKNSAKDIDKLVDYASNGFEFQTRQGAMNALKRLNIVDERVVGHAVQALLSTNNRLADVARGICEYWMQQTKARRMFREFVNSKSWEPGQREVLMRLVGDRAEPRRRR
jgi:aminopeptidase N